MIIRTQTTLSCITAVVAASLMACSDDFGIDDPPGASGALPASLLIHAHAAGEASFVDARNVLVTAIDTVAQARLLSGQPVTTGRVDLSGAEPSYTPTDGRALILVGPDDSGAIVEATFVIDTLEGQGNNGQEILGDNHNLVVEARMNGRFDILVTSQRNGINFGITVSGELLQRDEVLQVDLVRSGTQSSEVDSTGSSSNTDQTTSGTVASDEFTIAIDQSFEAGTITAGQDSATASTSLYRHTIDRGGDTFRFEDVRIRRNFRDGVPNRIVDEWRAEGRITRNGSNYGRYELAEEVVDRERGEGFVVVWFRRRDGADVEIERWQRIP